METTLDKKTIIKDAIKMAWPAVLETFFVSLASMIDTMMLGSLGEVQLSAASIGNNFS